VQTDVQPATARREGHPGRSRWTLYGVLVGSIVVLDQVTKVVVQQTLIPYRPVEVLGDIFRLTYIYNPGAAFGLNLGPHSRFIFLGLSMVAVVVLFYLYRSTPVEDWMRRVAVSLVTAGAIGNAIDRVRSPEGVIDFLDFGIGNLRWPVFNVADIAVTLGALMLAVSLWREGSDDADRPGPD
jgi:signal peptidase II